MAAHGSQRLRPRQLDENSALIVAVGWYGLGADRTLQRVLDRSFADLYANMDRLGRTAELSAGAERLSRSYRVRRGVRFGYAERCYFP
jgi:hypothetical protein